MSSVILQFIGKQKHTVQFLGTKLLPNFSLENKKPPAALRPAGDHWSGEATRMQGFAVEETRVDVMIGDEAAKDQTSVRKERPIWMTESTIITQDAVMVRIQISLF